ncbi:Ribosomal subunit interface protein [[Actinomadura] parvosata subsp. kistnae]|uniref:Ribosome hibernation promoting factor n=2 Tax=Nonomuraea TaxID=83681 RepID=A0A1V0A8Q5_9ACTN|nr:MULTISPECIES: ribosome-associated translation inhibitor RaiA [unclassified Nonomuraea]AQZ66580.1 ribosomal subunit interface protein [Nonomuraea sp. ATCC 55076]NJP93267.1 ribosome-associated translation inhibitor RaiA [Nonomuraea sp. FMUSA5-5]SPL95343.1 Ribosomal subunit interface protein [Actinomadura parvosata subsp. kistnae]
MDIIVKGRHTGVSDRFRDHVTTKLARIERLDNKLIRVDVEVSKERNPRLADQRERVELTIHSRGPAIRAEASADDRFAALDLALDKLEGRLRRLADRRKVHHGNHCPPSVAEITATLPAATDLAPRTQPDVPKQAEPDEDELQQKSDQLYDDIVPIEMDGDGPLIVREKFHRAEPMTIDQALLEMELVGHDFYLFRDKESGQPCVVYNRRGYNYGVLRLVEP